MATTKELLQQLQTEQPDYWAWLQSKAGALDKVRSLAQGGVTWKNYWSSIQGLKSFATWQAGGTEPPPDEVPPPEESPTEPPFPEFTPTVTPEIPIEQTEIYGLLQQFLVDNLLPSSLMGFIVQALKAKKPMSQIVAELRQTPEYKAAYPENDMRRDNGLAWMAEGEIRSYRDEARRITQLYLGVNPTNSEISQLIAKGKSLSEWEHHLQVNQTIKRWGGAVQQVFEQITGYALTDERLHDFFDNEVNTDNLDRMYARSLERGQPAQLGFGIRPDEEAAMLEQFGLDPNAIFQNYQKVAAEMPRFDRLAAIGGYLNGPGAGMFGDISVSGSLLFQAVQLGDPKAIAELQRRAAEETARYQAEGAPGRTQGGALSGLTARG